MTDVVVEDGNPADVTLATKMIERHRDILGAVPRQVAFDGGFASRKNLTDIKELGVQDVAFSKRLGLSITDMVTSSWVYRRLRDFRSGLEGVMRVSQTRLRMAAMHLPRIRILQGLRHRVLSCNLLVVARHLVARR